jgi:cleavage and polyadenylation specificity factor subunit 2
MSISLTRLSGPFPCPPAYLLSIDNAQILLDCGVYDRSPEPTLPSTSLEPTSEAVESYLEQLRLVAPQLSLVLLSHPLLTSLGLLPWLRSRCGLRCPVYATLPTREMGRYAVEEWVEARTQAERNESRQTDRNKKNDVTRPSSKKGKEKESDLTRMKEEDDETRPVLDNDDSTGPETTTKAKERDPWNQVWKLTSQEIREAFLAINAVRFTQPVHLSGPLKGYTLVAHRSGHTLGGSIYTLRPSLSSSLSPASSSSSLLYAPMFNHIKEHHLDPTSLLVGGNVDDNMRRMGVVVVGAQRSKMVNIKRIDRERKLLGKRKLSLFLFSSCSGDSALTRPNSSVLDLITTTLESSGSILLPTDPSARLFELLVLLESHWSFSNFTSRGYPLCLVSRTGREAVGFVRSLTEWMGGQVNGNTTGGGRDKGRPDILKFACVFHNPLSLSPLPVIEIRKTDPQTENRRTVI